MKEAATAIILAGGNSRRMGRNKALLPVNGRPLIQHIFGQLEPYFDQILLSTNDPGLYSFLDVECVQDKVPDRGPLMGIASAVAASNHPRNFVIASDIPEVRMDLVRRMLREVEGYDAVVPDIDGLQPLFAVYQKSILGAVDRVLASGQGRIRLVFDYCRVKYLHLESHYWLWDLNDPETYEAYLSEFCRESNIRETGIRDLKKATGG